MADAVTIITPAPVFVRKNGHWSTYTYRGFEINLESWGNGMFNGHMLDTLRNDFDLGMIASYMPKDEAIKDCVLTADAIRSDPNWYDDYDDNE